MRNPYEFCLILIKGTLKKFSSKFFLLIFHDFNSVYCLKFDIEFKFIVELLIFGQKKFHNISKRPLPYDFYTYLPQKYKKKSS